MRMDGRDVSISTPLREANPSARTDIMSVSCDESKLRSDRSKEIPIESEKKSGNNAQYGYDAIWPEHLAGRVEPWWPAKYNARSWQRAY
jgi:hypothetical protein